MTGLRATARAFAAVLVAAALFGCASSGDPVAPVSTTGPTSAPAPPPAAPGTDVRDGDLPRAPGLNYSRAQDVATAFAAASLSYRWDTTPEQQYAALAPYCTSRWLDGLAAAGAARTSAEWRRFVAEHGVARGQVRDALISPDAPVIPATTFVQITAVVITTRDGRPEESVDAALNVRLVWTDHGWRVAESNQI